MSTLLLCGDVLAMLSAMKDESVQTVITSPPYWGLRDYKIPPQVWRPRCLKDCPYDCEHEWVVKEQTVRTGTGGNWQQANNGPGLAEGVDRSRFKGDCSAANETEEQIIQTGFCQLCGAWYGSLGLEPTPELYTEHIVEVFEEVRRVLRSDGTLWFNIGDSYASGKGTCFNPGGGAESLGQERKNVHRVHPLDRGNKSTLAMSGLKPKDLVGIPWRVAFALQAYGWWLRSDIIWSKPNPMPESVTDRPTKAHEYLFLLTKSQKYFYDQDAIAEPCTMSTMERLSQPGLEQQEDSYRVPGKTNGPMKAVGKIDKQRGHGRRHDGFNDRWDAMEKAEQCAGTRNVRSVWTIATMPYKEAHFATFPEKLVEPCVLAGTSAKGACAKCGAPWKRVVEKTGERDCHSGNKKLSSLTVDRRGEQSLETSFLKDGKVGTYETTGWQPTCQCYGTDPLPKYPDEPDENAPGHERQAYERACEFTNKEWDRLLSMWSDLPSVPCIAFDPFSGSGTVMSVASRLGRKAVGVEINPAYCELIKKRLDGQTIGLPL